MTRSKRITIAARQCQYCGADITPEGLCGPCATHAVDELVNARVSLEEARRQLAYTEQMCWRLGGPSNARGETLAEMQDTLLDMAARIVAMQRA